MGDSGDMKSIKRNWRQPKKMMELWNTKFEGKVANQKIMTGKKLK